METDVAIIGAGFGGLGAAIRLSSGPASPTSSSSSGASDVGGTWRDNTYPGCACDVPSHLYSFSFAPNPDWSEHVLRPAGDLGLPARLRRPLRVRPTSAVRPRGAARRAGTTQRQRWRLRTSRRRPRARVLIAGDRPAQRPGHPRPARARRVRRHGVPLRPLAARPRPDRPARRGDRHRRLGHPVRARRSSRRSSS